MIRSASISSKRFPSSGSKIDMSKCDRDAAIPAKVVLSFVIRRISHKKKVLKAVQPLEEQLKEVNHHSTESKTNYTRLRRGYRLRLKNRIDHSKSMNICRFKAVKVGNKRCKSKQSRLEAVDAI